MLSIWGRQAFAIGLTAVLAIGAGPSTRPLLAPEQMRVLGHISASSLRGHVSFLASDKLEGRASPSPGLDIAAEYIAAQFRAAALEPAGDDDYFQTAVFHQISQTTEGFELTLVDGAHTVRVAPETVRIDSDQGIDLSAAAAVRPDDVSVAGKAVVTRLPAGTRSLAIRRELTEKKAAVIVDTSGADIETDRLVEAVPALIPRIVIRDKEAADAFEKAVSPKSEAKRGPPAVSLHLPAPQSREVKLRNVIGLLRGSDPALKNSYILISAHYDHLGRLPDGPGDRIYNGANDDASGTASVIEIAHALAGMRPPPKRSFVFAAFFGEERGGLGSRYYARHPLFPLDHTIADVNLEQLGRTDGTDGKKIARATLTGYSFSGISAVFRRAGRLTGINVHDTREGDEYFNRSDNLSFALRGIPAHTICVVFDYPDYHGVADEWPKLDYDNMARVDRMIALGALMLAASPSAPAWNAANPKTVRYRQAAPKPAAVPAGSVGQPPSQ